jgi:hypothetical protein
MHPFLSLQHNNGKPRRGIKHPDGGSSYLIYKWLKARTAKCKYRRELPKVEPKA